MSGSKPLLLVGAGNMGEALLRGWVTRKLTPIIVVEPNPSSEVRRIATRHRVTFVCDISAVGSRTVRACVIALKPQVLRTEAPRLREIAQSGATMLSIAAGTTIGALAKVWGPKARIVRAMPNLPGAIGHGISGVYAPRNATATDRKLAEFLLSALGETVWLKREALIDSVTAVSGSGPAYVFLMVEALAAAGEQEGLPSAVARRFARATLAGSGALLDHDARQPEELRRSVTSPGGTTQAALDVLTAKDAFKSLIVRAVSAARRRGKSLGR